jgi:quercetin dioxygenase-like cupin family protein
MRIVKSSEAPTLETVKGRHGVILVVGEKAMMTTPPHSHPHEQMGHVLEGKGILFAGGESIEVEAGTSFWIPPEQMGHVLEGKGILFAGGESIEVEAGTSFWIPPDVPHNFDATGNKPAILIEAFSPPREDYLEKVKK